RTIGGSIGMPPAMTSWGIALATLVCGLIAVLASHRRRDPKLEGRRLDWTIGQARQCLESGRPDEALGFLDALPVDEREGDLYPAYRSSALARLGRLDEAVFYLREIAGASSSELIKLQLAAVELLRGEALAASRLLDDVLESDQGNTAALALAGIVRYELGDLDGAQEICDRLEPHRPDNGRLQALRAIVAIDRGVSPDDWER